MSEERWGTIAVACDEGDPEEIKPQTAAEATRLWKYWRFNGSLEAERMRHCCGCQWLKQCGANLYCSHLLDTDERRGCPPGSSCAKKQTPPGWKYPKGYAEWCAELDKKYGRSNEKAKEKQIPIEWTVAQELYEAHYATSEIAEITGLSPNRIRERACYHNWKKENRGNLRASGRDLTEEKEAFRRRKEEFYGKTE